MKQKHTLTLAGLTLVAVGSLAVAVPALAHGPGGLGRGLGLGHGLGAGDARGARLAQELGVTQEALEAAQTRVLEKRLAEQVQAGRLTQAQADLILAGHTLRASIDHDALLAEALGLSAAELGAAREAGKTLSEVLEAQDLTAQAFREALQAAHEKATAQAVKDGVITPEQLDALQDARGRFGLRRGLRLGPGGLERGLRPQPAAPAAPSGSGLFRAPAPLRDDL
jgi:hypothetical protein